MVTPDELSKKGLFSYGLIAVIFMGGIFLGYEIKGNDDAMNSVDKIPSDIEKAEKRTRDYTEQEVSGLRNDMNREIELLRQDYEEHKEYSNKRMDRKIENHENVHHKE